MNFEAALRIDIGHSGDGRWSLDLTSTLREIKRRTAHSTGPMLAKRWSPLAAYPLLAQPKLNGIRLIASREGLHSRAGTLLTSLPHISAALAHLFRDAPDLVLDGEAYRHGMSLAEIAGAVMRNETNEASAQLQFHVFDQIGTQPGRQRIGALPRLLSRIAPCIAAVPTVDCRDSRDLDNHFASMLAHGYEGQMLRDPNAPYIRGRSNALMKRKPKPDGDDVLFAHHDAARDHVDLVQHAA